MFDFSDNLLSAVPTTAPKPMLDDKLGWQNHVMDKLYEFSINPDPKVALPALDKLAKTSVVGLTEEKPQVVLSLKSTSELQDEAMALIRRIVEREEKVINGPEKAAERPEIPLVTKSFGVVSSLPCDVN